MSDCGIPIGIQNTAWDVQGGDGIGIYKQMHMKCYSFVQRRSGRFLCLGNGTWKSDLACQVISIDCKDLHDNGQTNSGVYEIYPFGTSSRPVRVYCDMETMDGGWTGIQKRVDGSLSFDRTWTEYKKGFGDPDQDVWIGNDVIHLLTKGKNSSLYVSITLVDGSRLYALYDQFSVSNEEDKYRLFLAGFFEGSLGDSMLNTGDPSHDLSGMYFSTPERDNDRFTRGSCASICKGGWWFNNCYAAFLNGVMSGFWTSPWTPTVRVGSSVKETIMMTKRH
ncbi:fibroleukin-like [Saccostrea echinata]|uniref:fibroleukin-like n=1 Tax=Saccostrea echinata TaxID=191078 RepID=UPI002A818E63|nr:fibroleukin-like [Saccostrea echinata]